MSTALRWLTGFVTVFFFVTQARAADDEAWIGRQVMATMDATLAVGGRQAAVDSDLLPLTVSKVQGDWLWVGDAWIRKSSVISLEEAPQYYSTYLQSNPDNGEAYYRRGISWMARGEFAKAKSDYSEALRIDPDNLAALGDRGNARYNLGDDDGAIEDYTLVLKKNPNSATALKYRADALERRGEARSSVDDADRKKQDYAQALADYDAAIGIDPKFYDAYIARGRIKAGDMDFAGAIKDFDAAVGVDPSDPTGYRMRGDAIWDQVEWGTKQGEQPDRKELDKALADLGKAIELKPTPWYYFDRAQLYAEIHFDKSALSDYQEALRLKPDYRAAYFYRGKLYLRLLNNDGALADFSKAIELNPQEPEAYSERGGIYEAKGDLAKAVADYSTLISLVPNEMSYHIRRGRVLFRQRNFAGALADFDAATQIKSNHPLGYAERAWILATADDPQVRDGKQALADAGRAVELRKGGRMYEALAAAQAEQGNFAGALQSLSRANEAEPNVDSDLRAAMKAAFEAGKAYRSAG